MTTEKLQDAIGQLPADLIAATDRLRTASGTKVIQWKRWIAMAACLVLLLGCGVILRPGQVTGVGGNTHGGNGIADAVQNRSDHGGGITQHAAGAEKHTAQNGTGKTAESSGSFECKTVIYKNPF